MNAVVGDLSAAPQLDGAIFFGNCSQMRSILFAALGAASALSSGQCENLVQNGSFEDPLVTGPTRSQDGGNPANAKGGTSWLHFVNGEEGEEGKIVIGITDQIARTGKQALFIDFPKITEQSQRSELATKLIPIKPGQTYHISSWGRIDSKRPLSLDERRPHVWLNAEYFQPDGKTPVGELFSGVQLIPGSIVPGKKPELTYVSGEWTESVADVTPPEGAAFMQVTWSWVIGKDEGETDGVIYWDDVVVDDKGGTTPGIEKIEAKPQSSPPGSAVPIK